MLHFFSIIIPTLNEDHLLPKLLKDLKEQKLQNFEVIIVDGKSTDKTKELALSYAKNIPIKFFENERKNVSYQRNFGAKESQGKYLIFLDADVQVSPSFTTIAQKYIEKNKGLVFLPYVMPKEKKQYPDINLIFPFLNNLIALSQSFNRPFSAGGCMIWEKNFFLISGGFDENAIIAEDHGIIRKAHAWGVKAKFISQLKILFSLRRMKREGRLNILYKFMISHFYLLFNKDIDKKMFDWEMGGHVKKKDDKKSLLFDPKKIINDTKKFFQSVLAED